MLVIINSFTNHTEVLLDNTRIVDSQCIYR